MESYVSCVPVNLTWQGNDEDGGKNPRVLPHLVLRKPRAESQPHCSFSNDRCFLHMAESAQQAATALPSPGSWLSSRDKHQAGDCKTCSIVAVVVHAFHGEH